MNGSLLALTSLALACLTNAAPAQRVPDSELIQRLKLNAALFQHYEHGTDLKEKANAANSDIIEAPVSFETPTHCEACNNDSISREKHLRRTVNQTDLVVYATVIRNISTLAPGNSFIYTDAEITLSEVIKSAPEVPQKFSLPGAEITVAVPGGRVKSQGHKIEYKLQNRRGLEVGKTYLLFLKYVPMSDSFELTGPEGYEISGDSVRPVHEGDDFYGESKRSGSVLLGDVRASASAAKNGETR